MESTATIHLSKRVLVNFSAAWCSSCQTMEPTWEALSAAPPPHLELVQIDIDKHPQMVRTFKIISVPTFALFQDGKLLWRQSGLLTKRELLEAIAQHCTP